VSPYNSEFVAAARKLGGRWNAPAWSFDVRDEQRVRAACAEHYGTDGLTADLVTVRAEFGPDNDTLRGPIEIFGRPVARAFGRDSGAKLADGVLLLSGGFNSGGSVKNWRTKAQEGTVCLVRDLPRAAVERALADGATWLAIEPETAPIDRAALAAEREKLLVRVAEIDAALA
jgi:hypothetical protein